MFIETKYHHNMVDFRLASNETVLALSFKALASCIKLMKLPNVDNAVDLRVY